MLHVQRLSGHGWSWRRPLVSSAVIADVWAGLQRGRGLTLALALAGFIGIAAAQLVEARFLRVGLLLHVALLLGAGAVLAVALARTRRAGAEAADVAHDLRSPLVSLQVTLELLASDGFGTLPEEARAVALRAAAISSRAADVVARTLEHPISRATVFPAPATVDLNAVLREVTAALEVQIRATDAVVNVGTLPAVAGDACALFRVFSNLVQNGLKYHQSQVPPRVTVTAEVESGWAVIGVRDYGIGVPPEERTRIFDRRYRAAGSAPRAAGSGLGLATAHRLVTEMGGAVWLDGAIAPGTLVRVRVPLA